jgi:D-alanyl-D-alanine carboxypeptidase/D-alanyl-D-alanine-endopeptidase (penicillin-binding protein 4)
MIKSLRTGEILYKKNADKLFIPASTQKLFTTSAAAILLGDKFKYVTSLYLNGEIRNGKIAGDLVVKGFGDPTISSKFMNGGAARLFEEWADTLKAKGVNEILGDIIGDDSAFDDELLGKGWPSDSEQYFYAAESGALSLNDNCVYVTITPTFIGEHANITLSPLTEYVKIENKIITVSPNSDEGVTFERIHGTNEIVFKGKIRKNSKPVSEYVSVSNPTKFFLTVFREVLEKRGFKFAGEVLSSKELQSAPDEEDYILLASHKSIPLKDIIKETNKNSNNYFAEQLIKTIGYKQFNYGSVENGLKACRDLFNDMGVNLDYMYMVDGSGLSRLNLVTPRHIVNLLSYMYKSEAFETLYNSLPIAGIDGSLSARMRRTGAENNVRAKPGYNTGVSSLAGYVKTFEGEPLVFCMMVNNYIVPAALATYIQDLICIRLSNFSRN